MPMTTRTRLAFISTLIVALSLAPPAPSDEPAAALVRKAWAVTDAVLDNQVDPPARQDMLLGGLRELYRAANETPPADLGRRVSDVATPEQFTPLLRDLLGKVKAPEQVFLPGMVARASGRFLSPKERLAEEMLATNR